MGVSGTLKTLSDQEKYIIKDHYKIEYHTYMPSMFGANKLKFDKKEHVTVENKDDFYGSICDRIKVKLDNKRPVLVFFENKKKLLEFF